MLLISRGDCHTFNGSTWNPSHPLTESRIIAAAIPTSPLEEKSQKIFVSGGFNGQVRNSLEVLTRFTYFLRGEGGRC